MEKLVRLLSYVRSKINMPLTPREDSLDSAQWWVNGPFVICRDMKSHRGNDVRKRDNMLQFFTNNKSIRRVRQRDR